MQGTTFLSFSSVSFGISFEHTVQLPFTVFLYSPFPDNYAFLSLSPSQIKNIQSADTVPVHGHSPLVCYCFKKCYKLFPICDLWLVEISFQSEAKQLYVNLIFLWFTHILCSILIFPGKNEIVFLFNFYHNGTKKSRLFKPYIRNHGRRSHVLK